MASIGTNYDPTTTAQALAESVTAGRQQTLKRQSDTAIAVQKALAGLSSTLSAFQTSLSSLTGTGKTLAANSAVFSDTTIASATATPVAAAGTYAFFVEQIAASHKVSYVGMTDFTGNGSMTLGVGTGSFTIDLTTKATWTVRDLAAAINGATGNTSLSASVVTTGTTSELVLSSNATGAANTISVSTSGSADAALKTKINVTPNLLSAAQDAIVRIGSSTGTKITQASNTFSVIDGVSMTLTKAQAAGSAPVTLTVAADASKTTANVQAFVDAYNKLKSAVDALVNPADAKSGAAGGAFAGDSGVRALRDRLVSLLRGTGATSLAGFGIIATREGTLAVDGARLTKAMAANPTGLDTLIGSSSSTTPTGIAGKLDTYLKMWTNATNGQIGSRKTAVVKLQDTLADRQIALDRQFDNAYARYLKQFTELQTVQSSMSYNTSLFDALFSSSKD
jgi:flagellar hook-associated protein 2